MIYFRDNNGNEQLIAGIAGAGQTITQSITNGVTDKAPSSDAVYDALNSLITVPTTAPGEGQQRVYRIGDIQIIVGATRAIGNITSTSNKVTYTVPFKFTPSVHATNDANMGSPILLGWQNINGFTCGTSAQFDPGNEVNGVFAWVAIGVAAN